MKIVQVNDIPLERGLQHRGGTFHSRRLLEGEVGTLDNYHLTLGQLGGDFFSPRHRHSFEQIRFQVEGTLDYDRDGKLSPGMVGYFPEGMAYGPQTQLPDEVPKTLVLQCGGASGSCYLSRPESKAATEELLKIGEFKDGVFRRNDGVPGKRNLDGYQAIWEHVHGRPMTFPKARYPQPIMIEPANYDWLPVAGANGVFEKLLGVVSECRTEVGLLKLDSGAIHDGGGRGIYFIVSGSGKVGDKTFARHTTVFVERTETAQFIAAEATEIFHVGLPNLDAILRRDRANEIAAAE